MKCKGILTTVQVLINDSLCHPEQQKLVEVDLEPTMRARVESGTFVRGSSQRSSWRLVPSVTQQVKEAMAAEAKEKTESDVEGGKSQEGSAQVEQATELEELTFLGDDSEELVKDKPLRDVTLVAQDVEDEESTLEESVTMTFTIGSRGNQPMASNGDIKLNIVTSDGQQAGHGVELTSLAEEGGSSHDSFNAGTDQTTLPMTTNEN